MAATAAQAGPEDAQNRKRSPSVEELTVVEVVRGEWDVLDQRSAVEADRIADLGGKLPLLGRLAIRGTSYAFTPAKGAKIPKDYAARVPYLAHFTGECRVLPSFAPDTKMRAALDQQSGQAHARIALISFPARDSSTNSFMVIYSRDEKRVEL